MPVFEIEAGGKSFEVEAPNEAAALAAIQQTMPKQQPERSSMDAVLGMGKAFGSGVARGGAMMAGTSGDIKKLMSSAMPSLEAAGVPVEQSRQQFQEVLPEWMRRKSDQTGEVIGTKEVMGAIDRATGLPVTSYQPQNRAEKYAQRVGEFTPSAMMGGGGFLRGAVGAGMGSEFAGQMTEGTKYETPARIAGAFVGSMAPDVLRRAVTPNPVSPERQRLLDTLDQEGVTSLTAGQRTGNKTLQYAESILGDAPGAGNRATRTQQEGQRQFTEAAMRRAGAGPSAAPEILADNYQRLGNEFRDLSARNTLRMDQQFGQDLNNAIANYARVPPSQQRAIVENYVDDILQHAQAGGTMPGPYYQEMRSRLSRQSNSLRNTDPTLSEALRDIRNALDNNMERSISPADQQAWQTARQQYGAQKVLERAASRAGEAAAEGQIVPSNLRNAVTAQNHGAYARGQGDFAELARAGSGVMAPLPNSGTGQRAAIHTLATMLGGGAGSAITGNPISGMGVAALAGATAPAAMGRALMSRPAQGYLGNQLLLPNLEAMDPRTAALINALIAARVDQGRQLPAR